mgnify:CR=1 FL=1
MKQLRRALTLIRHDQPPSGGCVLKLDDDIRILHQVDPAAFRRLCVETATKSKPVTDFVPAAFRRLCVET